MASELKPCPFCGHDAAYIDWQDGFPAVVCGVCLVSGPRQENGSERLAVLGWNRRKEPNDG